MSHSFVQPAKKGKSFNTSVRETYSYFQCPESQQQIFLSHHWQLLSQKPSASQSCYILDTSSLHPCHLVELLLPIVTKRKY